MFPRSPRLRMWMRHQGVWVFHSVAALTVAFAYLWTAAIDSWPVMPYILFTAGAVISLYGAYFWCVAEGDAMDDNHATPAR